MSSQRKQVYLAVAGSVGIHLAVLFAWAFTVQWFPAAQAASQTPEQLKLEVVEATPAPTPTPGPALASTPPPPKLAFHDTADFPEASRPPKDAVVESDRNSEAASELPPTGDKPLPTQKGRALPHFAFDTHPFTPGNNDRRAAGQNVAENMPPPVPAAALPPPHPMSTPPARRVPAPAPATVADPRDVALVAPQSIPSNPADAEPNPYDPSFRPPTGMTEPPRPTPVSRGSSYRTMHERTQAVGSVNATGTASLASIATPKGRYEASVIGAIDRRWRQYFAVQESRMSIGNVVVVVVVDQQGKLGSSHVVSNTGNEALASVTLKAVLETTVPRMPDEVAAGLNGEGLSLPISFSTLPPPQ